MANCAILAHGIVAPASLVPPEERFKFFFDDEKLEKLAGLFARLNSSEKAGRQGIPPEYDPLTTSRPSAPHTTHRAGWIKQSIFSATLNFRY